MPHPGIKHGTVDSISWEPHPLLPGIKIKSIYSLQDNIGIVSFLACIEKGHRTEIHIHEDSDDILYVLEGSGKIFIEEVGELATALARDNRQEQQEEFADVLAWLCTLANINNVDLEKACYKYASNNVNGFK